MMTKMKTRLIIRTYSELIQLKTFRERFEYLKLDGRVGIETFGFDRYLNQRLYHSQEWISTRDYIIARDFGRDLAMEGHEIYGRIIVHHMNPVAIDDLLRFNNDLLDPEYLICTIHNTHNAIHYGDASLLITMPVERRPNDTCPWKRGE